MVFRFIKFGWIISVVAALASLLYVYAALPELVVYSLSDAVVAKGAMTREVFFYSALGLLALSNFLLYALSKNVRYKSESINLLLKKWQLSFATVLNFFYLIIFNFLQLVNGGESFDFHSFGYLIYIGIALIAGWLLILPILLVRVINANK